MASDWLIWGSSDKSKTGYELRALDPAIVGYIRQMEGEDFGLDSHGVEEIWKEGDIESTMQFQSKHDKAAFERKYSYYQHSVLQSTLDVQQRCSGAIQRRIENISRRRRDLSVRLIDERVVLCGTQQTIDDELGALEYDIMSDECDSSCLACGSDATTEYVSIEREEDERHDSYVKHTRVFEKPSAKTTANRPRQPSSFMQSRMKSKIAVNEHVGVYVYEANINRLTVDALVCPVDGSMSLDRGLASVLAAAAGESLIQGCQHYLQQHAQLPEGRAVVVAGGNLSCDYVILVNPGFRRACSLTAQQIQTAVRVALEEARLRALRSVALPIIGTGGGGITPSVSAQATSAAIKQHLAMPTCLTTCHVVGVDASVVSEVHRRITNEFSAGIVSTVWSLVKTTVGWE